ncbi:MAG: arginine ABC transporter substrate-binding protein [Enterobacteriaceae bacterium]
MKKISAALLVGLVAFTANAAETAHAETIRFGTEASYPPFEFMDKDNQIQGFDIDIARALCKEVKAECTFNNQSFDSLIPSLKFKRIDAAIAGMDITPERSKQADFTHSYYQNSAIFIADKGKFTSIAELKGKRVGLQNGTTHQKYLADKHKEVTVVPYDSYQNAIIDLKNGRLDAVFGDTAVINQWLQENPGLASVGEKITDPDYFGTGIAIAVRKGNSKLQQQFNQGLDKMHKDGTYQAIYQKWFKQ